MGPPGSATDCSLALSLWSKASCKGGKKQQSQHFDRCWVKWNSISNNITFHTWFVGSQGTDRGTSACLREIMYFLKTKYLCCFRSSSQWSAETDEYYWNCDIPWHTEGDVPDEFVLFTVVLPVQSDLFPGYCLLEPPLTFLWMNSRDTDSGAWMFVNPVDFLYFRISVELLTHSSVDFRKDKDSDIYWYNLSISLQNGNCNTMLKTISYTSQDATQRA